MIDRLLKLAQLDQRHPQIVVRIGKIGVEPQRVLILLDAFLHLACSQESTSPTGVYNGVMLSGYEQIEHHRESQEQTPTPTHATPPERPVSKSPFQSENTDHSQQN